MQHRKPDIHPQGPLGKALEARPPGLMGQGRRLRGAARRQRLPGDRLPPPITVAVDIKTLKLIALGVGATGQAPFHGGGGAD